MPSNDEGSRIILTVSEAQDDFLTQTVKKRGFLSRQDAIRYLITREMEATV